MFNNTGINHIKNFLSNNTIESLNEEIEEIFNNYFEINS